MLAPGKRKVALPGQRGASVDPKLTRAKACLVRAFERYELIAVLLRDDLGRLKAGQSIRLSDLAEVARKTFLRVHKGDRLNEADCRVSAESFENDVFFALSAGQRKLVELYKSGGNDQGYMLVISGNEVRWEKCPERIERFISEQIEALP